MTAWIWGRRPVLEALRAGRARRVLVARGRRSSEVLDEIRSAAQRGGIDVEEVAVSDLEHIAPGQNLQGVAAEINDRPAISLRDLLSSLAFPGFLLALDQIQDPHNVGALIRTADAAGVQGVILPERRSASLSGVVAKSSAGAAAYLPAIAVPNLSRALDDAREAGLWTVGLEGTAPQSIFEVDLTVPVALVVGGEGQGLRRLTRQHCDILASLPMRGAVASLNASVAGSIAMYEAVRQRLRQGT